MYPNSVTKNLPLATLFFALAIICVVATFIPVFNKVPFSEVVYCAYALLFGILALHKTQIISSEAPVGLWVKKAFMAISALFIIWGFLFAASI